MTKLPNQLSDDDKQRVICAVFGACSRDANFVTEIIDAACKGVEEFADFHSEKSAKAAFILTDLLDDKPLLASKHFTTSQIMDVVRPYIQGTKWLKEIEERQKTLREQSL